MRRSPSAPWALTLLLLALGTTSACLGKAKVNNGGGVAPTPNDGITKFACNPKQQPAMDQLRTLTNQQYLNTLNDLLTATIGATATASVMSDSGVQAAIAQLPPTQPVLPQTLPAVTPAIPGTDAAIANATKLAGTFPDGGWYRADQSVQAARVAALYEIGAAVAQVLAANDLGALVGSCALGTSGGTNTSCLTAFIQTFGTRALRRAITSADVTAYTAFYNLNGPDSTLTNPAASGYQDVLTGLFNAPEFIYFVEHGDTNSPVAGLQGVYQLDSYELASRLSYHVWDTMPDDELWSAAVDGSLSTASVYSAQVKRLFADPRAQSTLDQFFTDYFDARATGGPRGTGGLNYHNFADPNLLSDAEFAAFAGSDLPTDGNLYPDMLADAVGFADFYSWTTPGTLHDLLTSESSFAKTADVAKIYGVAAWDGMSAPAPFPAGQRPGLFTRALFVSAGIDTTPILKGVYFRRTVLCDTLGPPPPAAAGATVAATTFETTRDATTALTSAGACAGCHTKFIDPLGFASESFDGLGRFRTMETLFNSDGTVAKMLPVDTAVVPWVMLADGTTQAAGMADVMSIAEATGKPAACLTRNYFRYTFARYEDTTVDGCSLESMRATLDNNGSLASLWESVVSTPAFKQRTFQ